MSKFILLILSILISTSVCAVELSFNPNLSIGFRTGKTSLNDEPVAYIGPKVFLLKHEINNFSQINLIGPGLNYQTDGKFSLSVSPISVSSFTGLTLGLDYFIKEDDVKGGNIGIFLGLTFD